MRDSKTVSTEISAETETSAGKQKRALITRRQLIASARNIFARDGFEHARIEDIACEAGKTRGAFYSNFKDKEDVFFAIFEEDIDRDREAMGMLLRKRRTVKQRLEALAEYLGELGKDRQRTLLNLEFKVYAIRHPRRRKRLADLHAVMRLRCSVPEIDQCFPELSEPSAKKKREGSLAIGAILEGLALNRLFDPEALDDEQLNRYLSLCVNEALPMEKLSKPRGGSS